MTAEPETPKGPYSVYRGKAPFESTYWVALNKSDPVGVPFDGDVEATRVCWFVNDAYTEGYKAGRASREGIMDVARWAGGMDCQNTEKYFGQKPCDVCFSCSARKALAEDEKNG